MFSIALPVFAGVEYKKLMEGFGEEFFCLCFERYGSVLSALGCSLADFYSNLDGLYEHILSLGIVVGGKVSLSLLLPPLSLSLSR